MTKRKFTHPDNAPEGHQWQTRDGREVTQLTAFAVENGTYSLAGVAGGGQLRTWQPNGRLIPSRESSIDLCDAPVEHSAWLNIYLTDSGEAPRTCFAQGYMSKQVADKKAGVRRVACVKLTYEEGQSDD